MAVTVGGSPISTSQATELRTALGIPTIEEITDPLTPLVGTDTLVVVRSGAAYTTTMTDVKTYVDAATIVAGSAAGSWAVRNLVAGSVSGSWSVEDAAPASMSVVNATPGYTFGSVITATIPAVGSGNSLVIITKQDKTEITVDGGTEDSETTSLEGALVHFFHINNITDARTSVTIRAFVSGVPSNTSMDWSVLELDASGLVTASTAQATSQTTASISAAYTTTAANAAGIGYASYNNGPTTTTGTSGYTAEDDASGYNAVIYNADVGATGAKSMTATLSASRGLVTVVQAYAAA